MYLIIVFTLIIALIIYVLWGKSDNFCFIVILSLLGTVLYIVARPPAVERFTEKGELSSVDIPAFVRLANLKNDTLAILQPKLQDMIAAWKGTLQVEQEQKYDDKGNAVTEAPQDEVALDKSTEDEVRAVNKVLADLKKFDPAYYNAMLQMSEGSSVDEVLQEYPI